jgi:hypothetical protein
MDLKEVKDNDRIRVMVKPVQNRPCRKFKILSWRSFVDSASSRISCQEFTGRATLYDEAINLIWEEDGLDYQVCIPHDRICRIERASS